MRTILAAIALATSLSASAAAKAPIQLNCSPDTGDYIGQRFCTALRDNVARSPRYYEDSSQPARFVVHAVSTNIGDDSLSSAASVTLTVYIDRKELFVETWVLTIGSTKPEIQAVKIMAAIDDAINGSGQ
jgi:hypothetical protein